MTLNVGVTAEKKVLRLFGYSPFSKGDSSTFMLLYIIDKF